MAVPRNRHSISRRNNKRAHHALSRRLLCECPSCGAMRRPHRACASCGTYRGRSVTAVAKGEG